MVEARQPVVAAFMPPNGLESFLGRERDKSRPYKDLPMLMPLYGFVEGDTLGLLVLAHDTDTAEALAGRLASAARPRVVLDGETVVLHGGVALKPRDTLESAGVRALDRVDLRRKEHHAP